MTKIKKSPDLPDYFVEMDWRDRAKDPESFAEAMTGHYESGDVVILRNSPITLDYALLNQVILPKGAAYKKIRDDRFTRPRLNMESLRLHCYLIQHYPVIYRPFCREITQASAVIRDVAQQLFPHYRFTKMPCSWRFTPTGPEVIHIDEFGALNDEQEKWYLRIFMNVDEEPRKWNLGYTLDGLAEHYYEEAGMAKWRGGRGADFAREICERVYGVKCENREGDWPRHEIEWGTGDVWICDSLHHSHQVVKGRRMMATGFEIDPASMQNPALSLDSRVRAYHVRYGTLERQAS